MTGSNLAAHRMWAKTPAEHRFFNITEAHEAALRFRSESEEVDVRLAVDGKGKLVNRIVYATETENMILKGQPAKIGAKGREIILSETAWDQLAARAGITTAGLRKMIDIEHINREGVGENIASLVNLSIEARSTAIAKRPARNAEDKRSVDPTAFRALVHTPNPDEPSVALAILTPGYRRVWDCEVTEKLLPLTTEGGWKTPPCRPFDHSQPRIRPATEDDILKFAAHPQMGVKVGDEIAPGGAYVSPTGSFFLLVNEDQAICDPSGNPLYRGVIVSNSQTGNGALRVTTFWFQTVCGNHILMGVSSENTMEFRKVHKGKTIDAQLVHDFIGANREADTRLLLEAEVEVKRLSETIIGKDKAEVVKEVQKRLDNTARLVLPKRFLNSAYEYAEKAHTRTFAGSNGAPNSVWGFLGGMTEASQELPMYQRIAVDKAAANVMRTWSTFAPADEIGTEEPLEVAPV